jgi:hypothetical protein
MRRFLGQFRCEYKHILRYLTLKSYDINFLVLTVSRRLVYHHHCQCYYKYRTRACDLPHFIVDPNVVLAVECFIDHNFCGPNYNVSFWSNYD